MSNRPWSLNKVAFWTMVVITILFALALVLSMLGLNAKIISALQNVATAVAICLVAVLGWRYVRSRELVWKILYIICLLVVIAGIIIPLVK